MITIHELLTDPNYKQYFCSMPELPAHYAGGSTMPWRLIVMKKGEHHYRTKRFATYREAFLALKKLLPKITDGTINSPAIGFPPPTRVVKVKGQYFTTPKGKKVQKTKTIIWEAKVPADEFEPHYWCSYCRRTTVFRRMAHHGLLPASKLGVGIDPYLLRCVMCGASEQIVNLHKPGNLNPIR